MDYHLKPIEQFISTYLTPKNTFVERVHDIILDSLLIKLDEQFEMIKGQISESYYSFDEESTSTHFIQNHQHKIVIMTNQVSLNLAQENGSGAKSKKTVQKKVIRKLSALLKFLETEYNHCLDNSYFITTEYGIEKAFEYSKFLAKLNSPFFYCDSLMKIAIEPIETFIKSEKTKYKHFKIEYLDRLVAELDRLQRNSEYSFKNNLINVLISINFNNNDFMLYLTNMILNQIYKKETADEQVLTLRWHQKHYRQRISKRNMAFLIHRQNIKDQIVSWITEEIKFIEKSKQAQTIDNHYSVNTVVLDKFKLDLSMDQFCFLVKVGLVTGILVTEDVKALSILLSKHFSTKKKKNISADSIRNRIYKFEIEKPEILRSELINWINYNL